MSKKTDEGTDGKYYRAGRAEGVADMCADLRTILDPKDKLHMNREALLDEVHMHRLEYLRGVRRSEVWARRRFWAWMLIHALAIAAIAWNIYDNV